MIPRTFRRLGFAVLVGLLLAAALPAAGAASPPPPAAEDVVIAILDTGIAPHQEFAADQVVAWWDFTDASDDPRGRHFDPRRGPYDDHGHGTAVASMAAGRNVVPEKTPSFAPGAKLAVAKVVDGDGSVMFRMEDAIRWAVNVARADVINISIGTIVPVPFAPRHIYLAKYEALAYARERGVLVTVANGNGMGVGAVPGPGAWSPYASSLDVLAVGADGIDSLHTHFDPEVVASYRAHLADHTGPARYEDDQGTSFSSPRVAGLAARLKLEARAAGRDLAAGGLERLVKFSATDTDLPPSHEGYGDIDATAAALAIEHARAGTLPARPDPDVSGIYVEEVAGRQRALNDLRTGAPPDRGARPAPARPASFGRQLSRPGSLQRP